MAIIFQISRCHSSVFKRVELARNCVSSTCRAVQRRGVSHVAARRAPLHQRSVKAAAAATAEDDVDEAIDDLEEELPTDDEEDEPITSAAPEAAPAADDTTDLKFALNFLWMEKNIGVAVDQVFAKDQRSPVTEYYFWPTKDAWEELKVALEGKAWISEIEKVLLLNRTTEVINFWQVQEGDKPTVEQAREQFPDCVFKG